MRKLQTRSLRLGGLLASALLSTACFTPADFGADAHGAGHGEEQGEEGEHAEPNELLPAELVGHVQRDGGASLTLASTLLACSGCGSEDMSRLSEMSIVTAECAEPTHCEVETKVPAPSGPKPDGSAPETSEVDCSGSIVREGEALTITLAATTPDETKAKVCTSYSGSFTPVTGVTEGIIPGSEGRVLPPPKIPYDEAFEGDPKSSRTLDNGVIVDEFAAGDGLVAADGMVVAFKYKGYASSNGRQLNSSRGAAQKLLISDATREMDLFTAAVISGIEGMKPGGKRRITIPDDMVEAIQESMGSAGPMKIGELLVTIDVVSVTAAPNLEGLDAFSGPPLKSKTLTGGVEIHDYALGEGVAAKNGDMVVTHYIGHLDDGTEFDSSHKKGEGLETTAGGAGVIKGMSMALEGVKVGMLRKVVIPPELGYGPAGRPSIPPNSRLTFYLEITEVTPPNAAPGTTPPPQQPVTIERGGEPAPKPATPKPAPPKPDGGGE